MNNPERLFGVRGKYNRETGQWETTLHNEDGHVIEAREPITIANPTPSVLANWYLDRQRASFEGAEQPTSDAV